ncbi:asparaginase [Arenibaculum sp.]|uniref:asparaginase n=1 Tax=Arenibaculum sp. TaxID=2865862 RepID=UPI002E0D4C2B|nr:asparaginase [Arenibaculum sp.]
MSDESHSSCCGHEAGHKPDDAPVLVEVTRGGMVESRHHAVACVVDAEGRVVRHWGDFERPVYARSAIKSLQALPLIETGAADAFELGDEELALACASHAGEPVHTARVAAWLERIGLGPSDLECGVHLPYDEETAHDLLRRGEGPRPVHNNCSGKHAGMLTTAVHRGEPTRGYIRRDHPVQQRILGVLEQMTGHPLEGAPWGHDGCGIPTIAIPLGGIAFAMARIADPSGLPDRRAEAATRLRRAWSAHPHLVGGRGSYDTGLMKAAGSRVLLKVGAEGVMCAVVPELGLGAAVKVEDGAGRAAGVAMAAILGELGVLPDAGEDLAALLRPPLANRAGLRVGEVRPSDVLAGGPAA